MPTLIAGVVAIVVLYSLLQMFRAANPVVLARAIKIAGGVVARAGGARSAGQTSQVRSQFLDMRLDHDSGELSGQIVAGPNAGHLLDEFDLRQLIAMIPDFDAESVSLLESYLG